MTDQPHPAVGEGISASSCPFMSTSGQMSRQSPGAGSAGALVPSTGALYSLIHRHLSLSWEEGNSSLSRVEPLYLVLFSVSATLLASQLSRLLRGAYKKVQEKGLSTAMQEALISAVKRIPGVADKIHAEQQKMVDRVRESMGSDREGWRTELPADSVPAPVLLAELDALKAKDKKWEGKTSGTVYMGGRTYGEHMKLVSDAYLRFAHTNPLHPDVFPSVVQMEAEAVAMTAHILGAGGKHVGPTEKDGAHPQEQQEGGVQVKGGEAHQRWPRSALPDAVGTDEICGNVTSGGTESILMAVKVARDYMRHHKGVTQPELVMAESAHSAYDKACNYFGITLRRAPVGPDLRADLGAIRSMINSNTIMIVGSAPGFPHGVIDPIQELGALALRHGVCLHVDCCLGGFVLPFARKLGYPVAHFDFQVPGVTSISIDTHKYGLAPKGTSIVLYRTHELRKFQYVAVTEWTGGLYVSPTVAGSRSGGLIAGAWAALMSQGQEGYMKATEQLMKAASDVKKGIGEINGLRVLGDPAMTVVAFEMSSAPNDIYRVNDAMSAKGWTLNALQRPPSVHICLTLQHVESVQQFLEDLKESAQEVLSNPKAYQSGMAPVYGAAAKIPDRVAVKEFLVDLMETSF